jgi:hypothetical protein
MPHLIDKHEGETAKTVAATAAPIGPGFPADVIEKMARLEVWGSGFKDPGPDYCIFKAFDAEGKEIRTRTVGGY